ncbi:MAG: stage II sporulation protein M [Chromatiales bacterium]|nr:stage II sporulation protein M [Chromatiales bacterium]
MKQQRFEAARADDWARFEAQLERIETRRSTGPTAELHRFALHYRAIAHDLALARSRTYSSALVERLHGLARRGHDVLYRPRPATRAHFARFVAHEFPRTVRRHARLLWLAVALFYGPLLGIAAAVHHDPGLIYLIVDADTADGFEKLYSEDRESLARERESDSDWEMFGFYIWNNVAIGFRTYAGGMLFGLGTIFFLLFNGFYIGAVAGFVTSGAAMHNFLGFVIGHGAFELTAIAISGAAGLRLGAALVRPGHLRRVEALRAAGGESAPLIYGAALMFLVAAFIEAFWSSKGALPVEIKYSAGAALWALVVAYLVLAGRRDAV